MTKLFKKTKEFQNMGIDHIVGEYASCSMQLARAEILKEKLIESGQLVINWEFDDIQDGPSEWGWNDKEVKKFWKSDHFVEGCILTLNGEVLSSLWGIWDADNDYKRQIEAELMSEFPLTQLGWKISARGN